MTASRSLWVVSSAWQEVVKNTLRTGQNVFEKSVIGVISKLWRSGISVLIQIAPNRASYVCFNPGSIFHNSITLVIFENNNTIQKTYKAPYVTKMLFVGAGANDYNNDDDDDKISQIKKTTSFDELQNKVAADSYVNSSQLLYHTQTVCITV